MIEAYISAFFVTFFQTASAALFCFYIVKDELKKRKAIVALQTLLFICGNSLLFSITVMHFYEAFYLVIYVLCILSGWFYLQRVTDESRVWLFFLICMDFNFIFLCASCSYGISMLWFPEYISGPYVYEDIFTFSAPLIVLWAPFTLSMRALYLRLRELTVISSWKICGIPLLFSFFLWLQSVFLSPEDVGLLESFICQIFIILSSLVTYWQMVRALSNAEKVIREEEQLNHLLSQLNLQKARMEDMEAHEEELRRIRHDRRQHMEVLKGLLADNEIQKAREYLHDYEISVEEKVRAPLCENISVDIICRRYETLARQAGIQTKLTLHLTKKAGISGSDLSVILGNLWENAISAALDSPGEKLLNLTVSEKEGKVLIRMDNTYSGMVVQDGDTYRSTKAGRNYAAGIGLSSIQATAAKYGGMAKFSHTDQIFTASVLLFKNSNIA